MADELKLDTTNEEMISQAAETSAAVQANPEAAQPEAMITLPEPGTVAVVPVQAGQQVPVAFDLNDVQISVVGGDLQLDFGNGTLLMLEDFATASAGDNPPTLVLGDGTILPGDAIVFASAETDFAPAAGPALTSGGLGEYRTDFGEVIEGVDRLGVQGPTSLGENQETVLEDTSIVLDENDPPDALDDTITMAEDTTAVIPVLTNDSDPEGDPLTIIDLGSAQNGTVTLNDNGSVIYTPNENYNGDDSFTYTISDGQGGTDTATVYITVEPANDPPDAVNDATTTDEDTSVIIPVLNNDTDLDGDTLSVESVTQGQNGQVQINEDGTVTYTPNENFNGSDTFTYTITDGQGGTDTATVTVTIAAVNDAPEAADDFYSTDEDVALVVDGTIDPTVLANDNDLDLDTLTVNTTPLTDVTNGTLTLNADGTFTYTPDANFNGNDSFVYQVSDGAGGTAQATAYITVNPDNDAPEAADDFYTTNEDVALVVDGTIDPTVLANDNDLDLDTLTVNTTPLTDVANGTLTLNADGTFTYTPDANFNGNDSFVYQISDGAGGTAQATAYITVLPVNDAPAAADDFYSTNEDVALVVDGTIDSTVLANDNDLDLDTLTVNTTPITDVSNGSLTLNADGTFTYTPDTNFNGNDSFVYQISDGAGGTAQATAYITVIPVNDAPVAADDFYSTNEDVALVVDGTIDPTVLANDNDLDLDTLTVNTTPITDVSNGTLTLSADGTFTYTPDTNFNGNDSFVYQISDGAGGTAQATAYITVIPVNDAPTAADDHYTTDENITLEVDGSIDPTILANDNDIDLDTLTVNTTPIVDVDNGSLTLNADGTFTYAPDANFNGNDSFVYQVSDGAGGTAQATVYITVNPVNGAPEAADDYYSTNEDVALVVDGTINPTVLANDNDLDLDTLTVNTTPITDVSNGSLTLNADGTFTYTPDTNFNGNDSFVYQISDGAGGTAQATAYITVIPVNDAPVAVADNNTITELADDIISDNEVTGNVLTGASSGGTDSIDDNDPSGDSLFADFFVVTVDGTTVGDGATDVTLLGNYGTLTISGDGSYTYELDDANTTVQALNTDSTPLSDVFNYTMNDGDGGTDSANLTITINGVDDAVTLTAATNTTVSEEGLTYGNLDALPDGYALLPGDDPLNNPNDNTNLVINAGSFTLNADTQYTMDSISLATDATVKTADGVDITFNWVDGDYALIGSRDDNGDEVIRISVQSVTPNLDNYEVAYQVTLSEAIEHPFVGDGSGLIYDESSVTEDDEDELSLFIDVTAGDTTFTDAFTVTVEDDSPLNIMPDAAELPNLPLGTFTGNLDFDGQIEDNIGADQPGSVQFPVALETLTDTGLTSGGLNIHYDVSADGQTLTAYTVAGTVFTIALNVDGAGVDQYTINMIGTVDGGATSIDFNAGGYDFVGGNGAWAGFSTEANDDSFDLLLTPIGAGTVNTNANEGGVGGGNSVGPGEAIRADFVVDLTGDPKGTPYTDAANQDHVFDSHYEVNGASALFTHTTGSTVLIKAYDDADGNDVGDGVQDDITAIGISYGGGEVFVSSALGNSQTVTLDGHDFDVTFDGSDAQIAGVLQGVALSAFTADGYNSIEFWHDGGETFKIGDFGTTLTEPGQSVEFSVPLDIYDADGDMAAGTIDVVLTPDSDIGTASTLQALMVEDPMIYEFSANGGEGDLVIDGFDVNQDVIRLTDVLDLDTDGSLDSGDVSVGVFADGNDLVLTISGQDGVDTNVTLADVGSYQGVDSLDSLAQAGFQVEYSS
ncbi:tandem-95 repeat protein [uncultured Desulfuromonas sp.]|uniref:tandem-95 repeat protein n=1 Tax=uncultured Desulfuromonas sp. TaxID=181013 RepID=UPI002AABD3F3|nr:tandem-95 repeat protein [uncultured Desulfuromonas sp.]